jgi:prepilin-type processing-associated H-X9-DG protein
LVELLIVVAVLAVMISILIPSLQKARLLAQRTACSANLRGVGLAAGMYQADFDGYVPMCWGNIAEEHTNPWRSWRVLLLPYSSSIQAFNCSAADDTGVLGETFHSLDELTEQALSGTRNAGSYGVIYQHALPGCRQITYEGDIRRAHPAYSVAWPTQPGRAWRDPAASVYIADSYLALGPLNYPSPTSFKRYGTAAIFPPSDPTYADDSALTRRFADRHRGTNCLFVDGHVKSYQTAELDAMAEGSPDCVWDVE